MSKASQIRDMAIDEIEAAVSAVNKELYGIVNDAKMTKKSAQPHLKYQKKKEKARLLTVLHQKRSVVSKVRGV